MHRVAASSLELSEQRVRQHDAVWNDFVNTLYQVSEDDVNTLDLQAHTESEASESPASEDDEDVDETPAYKVSPQSIAASLVSYAVGVALGRWRYPMCSICRR